MDDQNAATAEERNMSTDVDSSPIARPSFWRRGSTHRRILGGVTVIALLGLGAVLISRCGVGSDDDSADSAAETEAWGDSAEAAYDAADEGMPAEEMEASAEESALGSSTDDDASALASGVPTVPTDYGRDIIYTASIAVQTADVATAASAATSIVQELGGFIFGQETFTEGHAHTTLVFKIRPESFAEALHRLSSVGELVNQTVNAQDVTGAIVDLDSRITSAATSVERMRTFLSQASDVRGVAELERELLQREVELERLRGQLRAMRDQVNLATITLAISASVEAQPTSSLVLRAWLAAGDDDPCLGFSNLVTEPKDEVSICIELENNGETTLADVAVSSDALRFRNDDLEMSAMSPGSDLARFAPGAHATATLREQVADGRIAGRIATRGLDIDIQVSALPITDRGQKLARLARSETLRLTVPEDDSPPGFWDALGSGWDALLAIGSIALLVLGAVLPFVPVAVIALAVAWWLRRRRARRSHTSSDSDEH